MSEEEKENKQKKTKKSKTQFGSAKVIGGDQVQTKKVKKKRYTVGKIKKIRVAPSAQKIFETIKV